MPVKELVQTTLAPEDATALRKVAASEGTTISAVLRRIVIQWAQTPEVRRLTTHEKDGKP